MSSSSRSYRESPVPVLETCTFVILCEGNVSFVSIPLFWVNNCITVLLQCISKPINLG